MTKQGERVDETIDDLEFHDVASIFPLMDEAALQELADDIAEQGLLEPIWVDAENRIVDGRNRYLACKRVGAEMLFRDAPTDGSLVSFVVSLNLKRRHLTKSQMAVVAFDMLPHLEAEALQRKSIGGRGGFDEDSPKMDTLTPGRATEKAGEIAGVGKSYVADVKSIAVDAPELVEKIRIGEKTITEAKREIKERGREERRAENAEKVAAAPEPGVLTGVYSTILIDPPWSPDDQGVNDVFGRTVPLYSVMSVEAIADLPVGALADENAHLYLWVTNRTVPIGWGLCEAWGFRPVTIITWCKPSIGMGNYFRNNTEHIVFGVKGSLPLREHNIGTWFQAPRGPDGHSSKPPEAYEMIELASHGPRLEMFARSKRDGWVSWGADA